MNFKFRVWDKKYKCWLKDNEYSLQNNNHLILYNCVGELIDTFYCGTDDSRFIIQQYTGLKDSEGNEVYEGDIVEKDNQTAEVFWNDTIGGFDLSWRENKYIHDESRFQFHFRNLLTMKVIGHINGI